MVTRLESGVAVRVARPGDEAGLARLDAAAWTPASGFPSVAERVNDPFFTVAPADRRRGVASALLAAAEQHARDRGARKLSLRVLSTNETAMRLYERLGFQREGTLRDEFRIDGRFVDDVLMAKQLA